MSSGVQVRPCSPSDAPLAAELILLSMGELGEFVWGSGNAGKARRVLSALFAKRGNRFSHQFAELAELDGKTVGLGLGYSACQMERLHLPTAWQLLTIWGPTEFVRFLRRVRPLMRAKEAESGEYFINTVAVSPGVQGTGIGGRLIACLETKARRQGLDRCSLCVEVENAGAQGFYGRYGYRIVETLQFDSLHGLIGYEGYHRMVKSLSEN